MKKGVMLLMVIFVSLIALGIVLAADINTYNFNYDTQRVSIQGLSKFNKISTENSVGGLLADFRTSAPLTSGVLLGSNALIISGQSETVFGFLNYPEPTLDDITSVRLSVEDSSNENYPVFVFDKFFDGYNQQFDILFGSQEYPTEIIVNGELVVIGDSNLVGIFANESYLEVGSDSNAAYLGFASLKDSVEESESSSVITYVADDDTMYFDKNLVVRDPSVGREVNFAESLNYLSKILATRMGESFLSGYRYSVNQCLELGGTVVNINGDVVTYERIGDGNDFCYFASSECPSGWESYVDWVVTSGGTCDFEDVISDIISDENNVLLCPDCDYSCSVLGSDGDIVDTIDFCSAAIPFEDSGRLSVELVECYANVEGRVCR